MSLAACHQEPAVLTASLERIDAPVQGCIDTITLHTNRASIHMTHYPAMAWCEFADSTVVLSMPANTQGREVHDSLVFAIEGDTLTLTIPVYQHYVAHVLRAKRHRLDFAQQGGSDTVAIELDTDTAPRLQVPEGYSAHLLPDNRLVVSCIEQPGRMSHGWLMLRAGELRDSIFLHQEGYTCPTCGGRGWVRCPDCKGGGYVSLDGTSQHMQGCPTCGGSGDYFDWDHLTPGRGSIPCPDCQL